MKNKLDWLKVLLVILISPLLTKILDISWIYTFIILLLSYLFFKFKNKIWWLVFLVLIVVNLQLNRLLYIDVNHLKISFDLEQSFFKYPGVGESIIRYHQEGLWLPYFLRNIFYSSYLVLFPWISSIMKMLSPILWIKTIGFSGISLMVLGIIQYFKKTKKDWFVVVWFLLITITSSLRVLGDSLTAVYLALPVIIYWLYLGCKNEIFRRYQVYWYILVFLDILSK